jgi:hypothetical protein
MMAVSALDERHQIGANRPPEPTPYEAVKTHLDDLLTEARNWADGAEVENQAQADEVSRLIEDLRLGLQAADKARVEEGEPFRVKLDEIQTRFNVYIAPTKNKVPGKVPVAMEALKAALKPYLDRLAAEKRAREIEAQRIADEAAQKAAEAAKAALAADLASREEAAALEAAAHAAQAAATKAANDKAQARGGSRAMGLTTYYVAVLTDRKAALLHFVQTQPEEITACLQRLADVDVRNGKRSVPGFSVEPRTRL